MTGLIAKARTLYAEAGTRVGVLEPIALFLARLLVARVFWRSGLGKVDTFEVLGLRFPTPSIENSTYFLFGNVYFPDLPDWAARLATVFAALGELTLPLLLVFGFLTRLGALGLLIMTLVIQIFVFPGEWWSVHAWWAAILLIIFVRGPGAISVDRYLKLEK